MERRKRFFGPWKPPTQFRIAASGRFTELAEIEHAMSTALAQALEGRTTTSQVVEHSRRVANTACTLGALVELREEEQERLRRAAQLHEIGMLAVPSDLLTRRSPLSPGELERVRSHARIGAEIVRVAYDERTALLVERQYEDYVDLRRRVTDTRELLVCGLLRAADVFDAMTTPRPYQDPVPEQRRRQVLQMGSGTKFHPAAVFALLRWAERDSA